MHRLSPRCGGKCRPFSISHKRRHTVQTAFCDVPKSHPRPLPMLFLVPKGTIHRVTASLFSQKHASRRTTAFLSKKESTIHRVTASLFPQKHAPRRMTAFLCKKKSTTHRVTASFFFQKYHHLVHPISHLKISYNLNYKLPPYFLMHYQQPIHSLCISKYGTISFYANISF